VAVACSGGRDSSALLHATLRAARPLGLQVLALHVHHGLSARADAWWRHVENSCLAAAAAGWPVRFLGQRVAVARRGGQSLEALAREARYAALAGMAAAAGCDTVLLAHHRRDQAETFLLQALRGAGPAGLSAMPQQATRAGLTWLRPWLDLDDAAIEAYVRHHRIAHIVDDTNADTRLARNRLRRAVWPALVAAFADAEPALSLSARWAQDAQACLVDLARIDLQATQGPAEDSATAPALRLADVLALGPARARNLLRHWLLARCGQAAAPQAFDRFWQALPLVGARSCRWHLVAGGEIRSYRGLLRWAPRAGQRIEREVAPAPIADLVIRRAGTYAVPAWGGRLRVERVTREGVALAGLAALQLRPRSGGEQFQMGERRVARALKKQFQAAGVPAWSREGPLGWVGEQLVFVPGLGIDARAWAAPGVPQVRLSWWPDEAPGDGAGFEPVHGR
jgi:tRNA(Ile)-lysidine synthase